MGNNNCLSINAKVIKSITTNNLCTDHHRDISKNLGFFESKIQLLSSFSKGSTHIKIYERFFMVTTDNNFQSILII